MASSAWHLSSACYARVSSHVLLHLHTLVAWGLLTFQTPHAAEDSLPELNYEGEPLKLSHFLQNGVRRPVLVRDLSHITPRPPTLLWAS